MNTTLCVLCIICTPCQLLITSVLELLFTTINFYKYTGKGKGNGTVNGTANHTYTTNVNTMDNGPVL